MLSIYKLDWKGFAAKTDENFLVENMIDRNFQNYIKQQKQELLKKLAFVPAKAAAAAPAPMDPSMMGGMPPMDPAMAGGAMPPMDPSMMGGMPMDPSMMGGMPPESAPAPDEEVLAVIDQMSQAMQGYETDLHDVKRDLDSMRTELAEAKGQMEAILKILNSGSAPTGPTGAAVPSM